MSVLPTSTLLQLLLPFGLGLSTSGGTPLWCLPRAATTGAGGAGQAPSLLPDTGISPEEIGWLPYLPGPKLLEHVCSAIIVFLMFFSDFAAFTLHNLQVLCVLGLTLALLTCQVVITIVKGCVALLRHNVLRVVRR